MPSSTGSLSIQFEGTFFTLWFPGQGWMAAQFLENLDPVLKAEEPRVAILKLLGYTLTMSPEAPPRRADEWVEVDLDTRVLATNSSLVRKAVRGEGIGPDDPVLPSTLERIYEILDAHDFKVELYR